MEDEDYRHDLFIKNYLLFILGAMMSTIFFLKPYIGKWMWLGLAPLALAVVLDLTTKEPVIE